MAITSPAGLLVFRCRNAASRHRLEADAKLALKAAGLQWIAGAVEEPIGIAKTSPTASRLIFAPLLELQIAASPKFYCRLRNRSEVQSLWITFDTNTRKATLATCATSVKRREARLM